MNQHHLIQCQITLHSNQKGLGGPFFVQERVIMQRQRIIIMSRNTVKGSQGGTVCRRKTNWCCNFSVLQRLRRRDNIQILTAGFAMQKNAPLQSNLHENAFNLHLKRNESLACRITHSYIVQEEEEGGKTPHGGKNQFSVLVCLQGSCVLFPT